MTYTVEMTEYTVDLYLGRAKFTIKVNAPDHESAEALVAALFPNCDDFYIYDE